MAEESLPPPDRFDDSVTPTSSRSPPICSRWPLPVLLLSLCKGGGGGHPANRKQPGAAQDQGGLKAKEPSGQKAPLVPSHFFGNESRRRCRHSPPPPAAAGSARNISFHFYPLVYRLSSAQAGNRGRDFPGLISAARWMPSGPGSQSELGETPSSRGGKGSEGLPRTPQLRVSELPLPLPYHRVFHYV